MATSDSGSPPTAAPVRNVVIFDVDEGGFATARAADLGRWIRGALDETLTDAGRTLADRNLAQALKEEIERAEMANAGTYEGAPIAGFAVRTKITQADWQAWHVLAAYDWNGSKVALKTSLTEQMGAESGTLVNILNVTGGGDTFKVAEGTIADPVVESGAVVVIDKADAETVEIGSRVKVDYSCSIAGCSFDSYWPL